MIFITIKLGKIESENNLTKTPPWLASHGGALGREITYLERLAQISP